MPSDSTLINITDRILQHEYYDNFPEIKNEIISTGRVFYIYKYPSDDMQIIGYISYIPKAKNSRTIIMVRGGNRSFGIPYPGSASNIRGYDTYIGTTIRSTNVIQLNMYIKFVEICQYL